MADLTTPLGVITAMEEWCEQRLAVLGKAQSANWRAGAESQVFILRTHVSDLRATIEDVDLYAKPAQTGVPAPIPVAAEDAIKALEEYADVQAKKIIKLEERMGFAEDRVLSNEDAISSMSDDIYKALAGVSDNDTSIAALHDPSVIDARYTIKPEAPIVRCVNEGVACRHYDLGSAEEPCKTCLGTGDIENNWEEPEPHACKRKGVLCRHNERTWKEAPCDTCVGDDSKTRKSWQAPETLDEARARWITVIGDPGDECLNCCKLSWSHGGGWGCSRSGDPFRTPPMVTIPGPCPHFKPAPYQPPTERTSDDNG